MIKKATLFGATVSFALILIALASNCYAAQDPFSKLGRGVANTLTGWIEIPKTVYSTSVESNALSGATLGLAKGVGMGIVRTGAGIFEAVTFPFALPQNYKPILEPEYVFD